jgi:hypothetical protein
MSKRIDAITKRYVSQNHIFADIVNYYIFDGEQKVMTLFVSWQKVEMLC